MIFEITPEIWKGLQPLRAQSGFQNLLDSLKKFQAQNLESLSVLEGNSLFRTQGAVQLLKQMFEAIENELPATANKEEEL